MNMRLTIVVVVCLLWMPLGNGGITRAYEEIENFQGVTIKGRIVFTGTIPKPATHEVTRDSEFCGDTFTITPMHVDAKSHGVAQVVVSVDGMVKGKPQSVAGSAPLLNAKCRFEPQTQVSSVNGTLEISSEDPVLHNTHLRLDDKTFLNIALPPKGRIIRKVLKKSGRLDVRCDAHKFMQSTIHVFPHPYFTITNEQGAFEISDVPPGKYHLSLWQEAVGTVQQAIIVPASGELSIAIDLNDFH